MLGTNTANQTHNLVVCSSHHTVLRSAHDFFSNRVITYWNQLPLHVQNLTSIRTGLDLFKLSKPELPNGFWKLLEEIFKRISDDREHVNYLLANGDVAMQQNMLFLIIFDFSILNNTFFIFITFFWKHILRLLSLDIFELVRVQSLKRSMKLTGSQLKLSRNIPSLMHFRSNPSMLGHKLARGAHTVRILDSIEYFLGRRPITLSR